MARFKDRDWDLPSDSNGRILTWAAVDTAVLMDIRDELKKLNALLSCTNFLEIPWQLTRMRRGIDKLNRPKIKKPKTT